MFSAGERVALSSINRQGDYPLLPDGGFKRNRFFHNFKDFALSIGASIFLAISWCWFTTHLLYEMSARPDKLVDGLYHVYGDTNGTGLVRGARVMVCRITRFHWWSSIHDDIQTFRPLSSGRYCPLGLGQGTKTSICIFFRVDTTRRKFASTNSHFACSANASPRFNSLAATQMWSRAIPVAF